jgi:hypothetical protein
LRTLGVRQDRAEEPAPIRACWPTRTFSSAVIVPKSRMFWNVRAMPAGHAPCRAGQLDVVAVEHDLASVGL